MMNLHHVEVKSASLLVIHCHALSSGMWNICPQLFSVLSHRTFQSFLKTTWKPGWQISTACSLWIISFYKQMWVFLFFFHSCNIFSTLLCLKWYLTFVCLCLLWLLCRMRRKQVSWSCWSLRSVTMLLFTLRSTMKNSSRICRASSPLSGTFWFLLARKSNMTWWEYRSLTALLCSFFEVCFPPYWRYTSSLLQLVSNAIQFLASVCERPHYKHLFEDQNTLTSICEKVIVPNMEFRSK